MHTRRLSYADILQEERARALREFNQCHTPSGAGGGQFCSKGGGTSKVAWAGAKKGYEVTDPSGRKFSTTHPDYANRIAGRTAVKTVGDAPGFTAGKGGPKPRVRGAALKQLRRTGKTEDTSKPSAHPLAPGKARGASAHLNQMVNYGGVMTSRANVMRDLQKSGATPAMVDRYMQGLERGQAAAASKKTRKPKSRLPKSSDRKQIWWTEQD